MGIANNAGPTITLLQNQTPYLAAGRQPTSTSPTIRSCSCAGGLGRRRDVGGRRGGNADLVAGGGSTVTSQSGWQLDSSTPQTTNTLQIRIIQALQEIDNAIGTTWTYIGVNAKWLVKINQHSSLNPTGG